MFVPRAVPGGDGTNTMFVLGGRLLHRSAMLPDPERSRRGVPAIWWCERSRVRCVSRGILPNRLYFSHCNALISGPKTYSCLKVTRM